MTAQPQTDIAQALAELEGWLEAHGRELPRDEDRAGALQQHLALMRAEADRLRKQLED
jgi:hypothetical protein